MSEARSKYERAAAGGPDHDAETQMDSMQPQTDDVPATDDATQVPSFSIGVVEHLQLQARDEK